MNLIEASKNEDFCVTDEMVLLQYEIEQKVHIGYNQPQNIGIGGSVVSDSPRTSQCPLINF